MSQIPWDFLLWVDADTMIVGPLSEALTKLFETMIERQATLAAMSLQTIASFLQNAKRSAADVTPFEKAIEKYGIDSDQPYYNAGVVAVRGSRAQFIRGERVVPKLLTLGFQT